MQSIYELSFKPTNAFRFSSTPHRVGPLQIRPLHLSILYLYQFTCVYCLIKRNLMSLPPWLKLKTWLYFIFQLTVYKKISGSLKLRLKLNCSWVMIIKPNKFYSSEILFAQQIQMKPHFPVSLVRSIQSWFTRVPTHTDHPNILSSKLDTRSPSI